MATIKSPSSNDGAVKKTMAQYIDTQQQRQHKFCGICFDFKEDSDLFRGSKCKHVPFCSDCISKHVAVQIQQHNALKVYCPNPDCGVELKPEHLDCILPKEVVDRWKSARCESLIALRNKTYCPYKDCSILVVDDGGEVVTSAECPSCHRLLCAQCMFPWHAGMSCKQFKRKSEMFKEEENAERKLLDLAKLNMWQRCPKCNIYVERSIGCLNMRCRCGCNFCYKCGRHWKQNGHICPRNNDSDRISDIIFIICFFALFSFLLFKMADLVRSLGN